MWVNNDLLEIGKFDTKAKAIEVFKVSHTQQLPTNVVYECLTRLLFPSAFRATWSSTTVPTRWASTARASTTSPLCPTTSRPSEAATAATSSQVRSAVVHAVGVR